MKALQKTLVIIACLILSTQTIRHAYLIWFQPRTSVLDRYDKPLKNEISAATSLDQLVSKYAPLREEVDKIKATHRVDDPKSSFRDEEDTEPFKSEGQLKQAITDWEQRTKDIYEMRFYWGIGLIFVLAGLLVYRKMNSWAGMVMMIVGLSEQVYWTFPSFMSESTKEYDRLLRYKFTFSSLTILVLVAVIIGIRVFHENNDSESKRAPNQAL